MSFKLLAIRPLKGCSDNVRKNLQEDEFYFFDNSYKQSKDGNYIVKKEDATELSNDFFLQQNKESSLEYINVQAIVGMNGSGKSALIEFLLRILNNFFKSYGIGRSTESLIYSKGVIGELFFYSNSFVYKIYVNSEDFDKIQEKGGIIDVLNAKLFKDIEDEIFDSKKLNQREENNDLFPLESLFFSMYVNYSLYGMDENSFNSENLHTTIQKKELESNKLSSADSWLSSILHKNDGYQVPLVVHPHREEAFIDIRKEKYLMNQRLASLVFTDEGFRSTLADFQFEEIIIHKKPKKINYLIDGIVKKQNEESNTIAPQNYKEIQRIISSTKASLNCKMDQLFSFVEKYKLFFNKLPDSAKSTDLKIYLLFAYSLMSDRSEFGDYVIKQSIPGSIDVQIIKKSNSFSDYPKEYIQNLIERLPVDTHLQDFLNDELLNDLVIDQRFKNTYISLSKLSYNSLMELLVFFYSFGFWKEKLNLSDEKLNNILEKEELTSDLFWYLVVKTGGIKKYKRFKFLEPLVKFSAICNLLDGEIGRYKNERELFFSRVFDDNSHITIKLKQCFVLLDLFLEHPNNDIKNQYLNVYNNKESSLILKDFGKALLSTSKKYSLELTKLLPPSIFKYSFLAKRKGDMISITDLSSGQFQKISLLSSILYHLKNIDSVEEILTSNKKNYLFRNVNLILDEIELYFHPEQQRTFVNDLLVLLKKNEFKQIKNINLMFITHSPFILSDIPSQNVLKLEDGMPKKDDGVNSFGANIHDLLADEFFLKKDGSMGEFAKEKINSLIKFLQVKILRNREANSTDEKEKKNINEEIKGIGEIVEYGKDTCTQIIYLIGEPMLRLSLEGIYKEAFTIDKSVEDIDDEIIRLQERRKELLKNN